MNSRLTWLVISLSISALLSAQSYFQQEVNHTIKVRLDDAAHTLHGIELVEYINNSPDTLTFIYFHIWPNAYKNKSTAFARQKLALGSRRFHFARPEDRGYIDSLNFSAQGELLHWSLDNEHIDICKVDLNVPLLPGDTLVLEIPFFVKIPGSFSRMGHVGQSYQITQWFPKPAVYDKNGWNPMPYLEMGEFYSEFGTYRVSITVPGNYVVGATGNLLDTNELAWLNEKVLQSGHALQNTEGNAFPSPDDGSKTLHYRAEKVHDFAWFADKRYLVQKDEIVLASGRKVTTWAMYLPQEAELWKNASEYIHDALRYYSQWYGEYPYDNCSAVRGAISAGGAMEYPTITVVGKANTPTMLENFIMHEVGHNWFYGVLGFNERKYPLLDEGLNTFSEFRYMRTKYPEKQLSEMVIEKRRPAAFLNLNRIPFPRYYELIYLFSARMNMDQPMNLRSEEYDKLNYGAIIYDKSALAFSYLLGYLGEDTFNCIMQSFYEKWKFKHPDPADLRLVFEEQSTKDLSWFFDELIPSTGKIDYTIKRMKKDSILVKNNGDLASPLSYSGLIHHEPAYRIWQKGFSGEKWINLPPDTVQQVVLFDSTWLPELHRKNNSIRCQGILRKMEPINIHGLQLLERSDRTQIGILPAIGWNNYNKLMLGVFLYNPLLPQQAFEYQLAPMIGLGNMDFTGIGSIGLNLYPHSRFLQSLQVRLSAMSFGFEEDRKGSFNRARADLLFTLRKKSPVSPVYNSIRLSYIGADRMGEFEWSDNFFTMSYGIIDILHENRNVINPYSGRLNVEITKDFTKSFLELRYDHAFGYAEDAIQIRCFAGGFLFKDNTIDSLYQYHLSGTSGSDDYKFENLYLGRFENPNDPGRDIMLSQQFTADQGGFASYCPWAISDRWLASIGCNFRIYRLPVYIYGNAGTYSGAGKNQLVHGETVVKSAPVAYEAGAMINLGNIIRIYFPLITSSDIKEVNDLYFDNYWQTIRFTLNLNALNPFAMKEKLF
ncbi:MAG: M1 family metallopeptidase [Bacteroidales bacterium]|nr:M1 family metallopeptidase [Bacteroidales bacterium]